MNLNVAGACHSALDAAGRTRQVPRNGRLLSCEKKDSTQVSGVKEAIARLKGVTYYRSIANSDTFHHGPHLCSLAQNKLPRPRQVAPFDTQPAKLISDVWVMCSGKLTCKFIHPLAEQLSDVLPYARAQDGGEEACIEGT